MVTSTGFIVTATAGFHLAVGAAGHAGRYSILNGDSLDGRGRAQGDRLFILQALVGRSRAIYGVDLEPLWQGAAIMQGCRQARRRGGRQAVRHICGLIKNNERLTISRKPFDLTFNKLTSVSR